MASIRERILAGEFHHTLSVPAVPEFICTCGYRPASIMKFCPMCGMSLAEQKSGGVWDTYRDANRDMRNEAIALTTTFISACAKAYDIDWAGAEKLKAIYDVVVDISDCSHSLGDENLLRISKSFKKMAEVLNECFSPIA